MATGMAASDAVLPVLLEEAVAVHDRHHQIEQDDRGGSIQAAESVSASRPFAALRTEKPPILEDVGERLANVEIVVDDEDGTFRTFHR